MTMIDRIRAEIDRLYGEYKAKFHQNGDSYHLGIIDGLDMAERILDTLPDESEQPTRGYDEAYLNEKIAKASKSWEGVDVDKFMDEIRGREPVSDDLEEEYKEYVDNDPVFSKLVNRNAGISIARHFAEWGAKHTPLPEDTVLFQKGVEEGKRLMMEGATYNELMELYRAIRDELVKRHRDVPINIKEEQ